MSEREQRITRWILSAMLVAAVLIAAGTAWVAWHPLLGAAVLLASAAGLWYVVTNREHTARVSRERAAESAKARQVSTAGFETARPQVPAQPFGGGS